MRDKQSGTRSALLLVRLDVGQPPGPVAFHAETLGSA